MKLVCKENQDNQTKHITITLQDTCINLVETSRHAVLNSRDTKSANVKSIGPVAENKAFIYNVMGTQLADNWESWNFAPR